MELQKTHFWCIVCSSYFKISDSEEHVCYFKDNLVCEYNMYNISERGVAIFYCVYCSNVVRWGQEVRCLAKEFSIICQFQIPRPYFCSYTNCSLHPGIQTVFCTKHPNFKKATIIEYDSHFYNAKPPNLCIYCHEPKEGNAAYCHERKKIENLSEYLNKFPLLSRSRFKKTPDIIWEMGMIVKNVSCFLYGTFEYYFTYIGNTLHFYSLYRGKNF